MSGAHLSSMYEQVSKTAHVVWRNKVLRVLRPQSRQTTCGLEKSSPTIYICMVIIAIILFCIVLHELDMGIFGVGWENCRLMLFQSIHISLCKFFFVYFSIRIYFFYFTHSFFKTPHIRLFILHYILLKYYLFIN